MLDILFSLFVALFCSVEEGNDGCNYNNKNLYSDKIELDTRIIDVKRYKQDIDIYGESYVEIGRQNGLYSYIKEF